MSKNWMYKPIKLSTLLPHTFPGIDTFIKNGDNFVLYKGKNLIFTSKDKARLVDNCVEYLYIKSSDLNHYNQYVENNLSNIMRDESLDVVERKSILCQSTINYVGELFENCKSIRANIGRSISLIEKLMANLMDLDEAMEVLAPLLGHHHYTYIHSVQVATYNLALHTKMFSLQRDELLDIGVGSLFHDFGKIYVPTEILNKPGRLTEYEFEIMKQHPIRGAEFLKHETNLSDVALTIVGMHHEKDNGLGYPYNRRAMDIPRSCKISAIADVYSALTTNRAYRLALPKEEALNIMENDMDGAFDRYYLEQFRELVTKESDEKSEDVSL